MGMKHKAVKKSGDILYAWEWCDEHDNNMRGATIKNVGAPVDPTDVVRKTELDAHKASIDNHDDVVITTPTDGEILTYDSVTAKWTNRALPTILRNKLDFSTVIRLMLSPHVSCPEGLCLSNIKVLALLPTEIDEAFTWVLGSGTTKTVYSDHIEINAAAGTQNWGYINLPAPVGEAYLCMNAVDVDGLLDIWIDFCDGDGSTLQNPPDRYYFGLSVHMPTSDYRILKLVGTTATTLASESIDLTPNQMYFLEAYHNAAGHQKFYRDKKPKLFATDSDVDIPTIQSIRIRIAETTGTAAHVAKIFPPLIILTE